MLSFATVFLASIVGSSLGAAVNNTGLVDTLRDAATAVDRVNDLPKDSQFVFDFFNPTAGVSTGAGGSVILANVASFPAVVGNGAAMAVGILEPCGMNTPHTHPRATEIQFNVNGTIRTGMITENGGRFIMTDLQPGQMTIFPQGSIHFQINEGCEPALFVSGLNSEDPGALQIAQRFLGLPPDIVAATLGDIGIEEVMGLNDLIPDSVALGTDECLQRCGITRTSQPTTQQQTRVSGNAFPSGVTASTYATGYQSAPTTSSKSH
ncbi:RmlC-like cupin [Mycena sanguinolenta]|uniref:RmlC-like cupin n=1 Tax=Mycena sanguinolenta TaxID=230812 RepID=A0A8H6X4G3_9AGAR|nr:RmlC-like cupin [Mycena sanguinolenta]